MILEPDKSRTRTTIRDWRKAGYKIGLVPTMGYFHQGHIALMKKASELCDKVVVSLFVNPTQFGPDEDLTVYPRDMEGDTRKAERAGVDLIFYPEVGQMYGASHQTTVAVSELTREFCGSGRPGHFQGVTTIVAKLFNIVEPDIAIFGEKDYQQLLTIKRMANDLDFPIEVVGYPIVREADGIAMSSRNAYLSSDERVSARVLFKALNHLKERTGPDSSKHQVDSALQEARSLISNEEGCSLEYLSIVDGETLKETALISCSSRALGAIRIHNRIRLLDNIPLAG